MIAGRHIVALATCGAAVTLLSACGSVPEPRRPVFGQVVVEQHSPARHPHVPHPPATTPTPHAPRQPPPERAARPYLWSEHWDSMTFSLVRSGSPRRVLRVLAAGVAASRIKSAARALDDANRRPYRSSGPYYSALLARRIGGWTLTMQDLGLVANDSANLVRLSRHGAAAGFYADVNANYEFSYARDGRLLRDFDPFDYNDLSDGQHRLPQERGIRFGSETAIYPEARSLLLIQRLTGIRLHASDFDLARFSLGVVVED